MLTENTTVNLFDIFESSLLDLFIWTKLVPKEAETKIGFVSCHGNREDPNFLMFNIIWKMENTCV
jgi:hypothetical protein